jgi:hypothetical protein
LEVRKNLATNLSGNSVPEACRTPQALKYQWDIRMPLAPRSGVSLFDFGHLGFRSEQSGTNQLTSPCTHLTLHPALKLTARIPVYNGFHFFSLILKDCCSRGGMG